jgi:hypothetical protein
MPAPLAVYSGPRDRRGNNDIAGTAGRSSTRWPPLGSRPVHERRAGHRKGVGTPWPVGGVAEWSNAPVLKTGRGVSLSGVRIPPPPLLIPSAAA